MSSAEARAAELEKLLREILERETSLRLSIHRQKDLPNLKGAYKCAPECSFCAAEESLGR